MARRTKSDIPERDDKKGRRAYKRRIRPRFSRAQSLGIGLIFIGMAATVAAVGDAFGGMIAFIVAVLALGAALLVPIPTIPGDWRDDD